LVKKIFFAIQGYDSSVAKGQGAQPPNPPDKTIRLNCSKFAKSVSLFWRN